MQKMGIQKIRERILGVPMGQLFDIPQVFHSYFTERDRSL
jgi:hypothetical protein